MDTVSHALIGIAAAGLSGQPVSFSDPVYLATLIGSQAPDFDIITYVKGNFTYLKHHRGFSHSIPGIIMCSFLTCLGFSLYYPQEILPNIFFWSFVGSLTHIILDYFNTHGAAFLWPVSKRRLSLNLLNVVDPCLLTLVLAVFFLRLPPVIMSVTVFAVWACYLGFRSYLRHRAYKELSRLFDNPVETVVLPSLKRIFFWDFIVKTAGQIYIGQIGALNPAVSIYAKLSKEQATDLTLAAQKTGIGQFFSLFTPLSYFKEFKERTDAADNEKTVRIFDLRYCSEEGFAYSGTIIFGEDGLPCDSYICAYEKNFKMKI